MKTVTQFKPTTDPNVIQEWAEERGGIPAIKDENKLVIIFDEETEATENLRKISWEDFFQKFQEDNLQFMHEEERKDGTLSIQYKIVKNTEAPSTS